MGCACDYSLPLVVDTGSKFWLPLHDLNCEELNLSNGTIIAQPPEAARAIDRAHVSIPDKLHIVFHLLFLFTPILQPGGCLTWLKVVESSLFIRD